MMGRTDEIWSWHRGLGHINFDNLVKISTKECVKNMPRIIKLENTMCRACLHGKQTRRRFKTKYYSTSKPLELIHTYLCRPIRTESIHVGMMTIMVIIDVKWDDIGDVEGGIRCHD